ncbi:hypothetical protein BD779DRAFT_1150524 [Infundibulicybe gibba]|nr:hypothetical protein BD779DRAFT_1150524 [Infundibulicybe gibba]
MPCILLLLLLLLRELLCRHLFVSASTIEPLNLTNTSDSSPMYPLRCSPTGSGCNPSASTLNTNNASTIYFLQPSTHTLVPGRRNTPTTEPSPGAIYDMHVIHQSPHQTLLCIPLASSTPLQCSYLSGPQAQRRRPPRPHPWWRTLLDESGLYL